MKLELKEEQINVVLQALSKLPYIEVVNLIQEIVKQAQEQQSKEEKKK
jgi:hypothetical protein